MWDECLTKAGPHQLHVLDHTLGGLVDTHLQQSVGPEMPNFWYEPT